MNELELAQFAMPAANTLLAAMVTDGWEAFKARFSRIVAGRSGDMQTTEGSIEELRQRVVDYETRGHVEQGQSEIFALLCAVLAKNPEAQESLRELLSEIDASRSEDNAPRVSQNATVKDNGVSFQQVSGTQNYHAN
jgi:putative component of toxin-antitoxin plasmid stabilization module